MTRRADPLLVPHPDRFAPGAPGYGPALRAHAAALAAGEDGYLDPRTGYFVFTARYLLERGDCCEAGCRHCPFHTGDGDTPPAGAPPG